MDSICWTEYERRTCHLLRRAPLVCTARLCSEEHASAGEFFYISKLVSSVIKAEGVAGVWVRQVTGRHVGHCRPEGTVFTAISVDLESNLKREFLVLSNPAPSQGGSPCGP